MCDSSHLRFLGPRAFAFSLRVKPKPQIRFVLLQLLLDSGLYESNDESAARKEVLHRLDQVNCLFDLRLLLFERVDYCAGVLFIHLFNLCEWCSSKFYRSIV